MDEVFIIMQIGNEELDSVCDAAIIPAIEAAGLTPRRVDRHNTGDLLKSEIVRFIERSLIIVADVTNERPNCYLEVGYTMGLGKNAHLILTAREDHHHGSPNFDRNGPKVHFDLEGYDILFWAPGDLDGFRDRLAERISRRATIVTPDLPAEFRAESPFAWADPLRTRAVEGLNGVGHQAYMEVSASIVPGGSHIQRDLLDQIRNANVHTFGWPIGIVMDNPPDYRPSPVADGVEAEISCTDAAGNTRNHYDYWKAFQDGRFYTLLSLFEEKRAPDAIYWDVRAGRVHEALLFLARLYRRLGASDIDRVTIRIRHAGLAGRELRVAESVRMTQGGRTSAEDVVEHTVTAPLVDLEDNLNTYVKQMVDPLYVVFDFFEVSQAIINDVVAKFKDGVN